jgi:hypothetical protein
MIKLGEIKFDSGDSGPGTLELLSEGDYMWIRIHKFGPEEEKSFRSEEKRDPEQWKTFKLSNRNLKFIHQWADRHIRF